MKRFLAILCTLAMLLSVLNPAVFAAENSDLRAAMDDVSSEIIVLEEDTSNLTVNRDTTIDLNGHDLDSVSVLAGTLYIMDSATADYTVADGVYGHVTGVTGAVKAAEGYLQVGDSFHAVNLDIYAMTLRAADVGVYYKSNFAADEIVAAEVESFGVALSVVTAPSASNLETYCGYSEFTGFEAGEGANSVGTSTLLKGIMKEANGDNKNAKNAAMPIYGRAYIKTADGYVFGETVGRSLQEQVEAIDGVWEKLTDAQKAPVLGMLESYASVMEGWNIPNIQGIQVPGVDTEIEMPIEVTTENGIVTEGVAVEQDGVSVTVPAGTKLAEGAEKLTLTVTPKETSDTDIELEKNEVLMPMDVHVEGLAADNAQPLTISLGKVMPENLNMGNYTVYHVENGKTNEMVLIPVDAQFTAHNQYKYSLDGELTLYVANFSEIAPLATTNNAWNGSRDYGWYTENPNADKFYIRNADQLAGLGAIVGGMAKDENGAYIYTETIGEDTIHSYSFAGKTVVLTADISIGDLSADDGRTAPDGSNLVFYPIGYYNDTESYMKESDIAVNSWFKPFRGTFDGNGNTISDFYQNTWEMFGDYNDGYSGTPNYYREGMGLFGKVYGGTVRNLNVRNFSCDSEHGTSGVIASYADCGATFENIAIFDCNPRVYNIGNGGIVGCSGWYAKEAATEKVKFCNITVDNTNKISALWDASGTSAGGILGQYYPKSGQSAYNYPENPGVHFKDCRISAILEVNNDCISNYHYYWYRYTGMLMGSVRANKIVDGYTMADTTGITAEDCEVSFGYWNEFWYCELVKNSIASYTHDYQFGRLTSITDVKQIQDENGNWNQEGNFALLDANRNCEDCYHIFKNSEGELYRHFHNVADETNPNIYESFDLDGNGKLDDLKEDRQRYLLPFNQILTGDGMGILAHREFEGVTIVKKDEAGIRSSQEKFAAADNICLVNGELKLSDIFAVKDDATISVGSVQAYISPVGEDSTVKPAACVISNGDWENGILNIEGYGAAKITITDYWYCTPTVVNVSIGERLPVQKFEAANNFRDDATYPIQSAIKLSDLFKAVSGLATNQSIQSSGVQVTVAPADENSTVSGTFVQGDTWEQGTVTFTGEGAATVTITDMDACLPTTLNVIINPYTADLYFAEGTTNAYCPVCEAKVTWTEIAGGEKTTNVGHLVKGQHYYVAGDITYVGNSAIPLDDLPVSYISGPSAYANLNGEDKIGEPACLHLNGKNITSTVVKDAKDYVIFGGNGRLNVMGSGKVASIGTEEKLNDGGPAVVCNTVGYGLIHLYSGTYESDSRSNAYALAINGTGGKLVLHKDVVVNGGTNKKAIFIGTAGLRAADLQINGATINGDIEVSSPALNTSGQFADAAKYPCYANAANTTVELNGAKISGTITATYNEATTYNNSLTITVAGSTMIDNLSLLGTARLTLGELTEGANITVADKDGQITAEPNAKAKNYQKYFHTVDDSKYIAVGEDNHLYHRTHKITDDLVFQEGTTNAYCVHCGAIVSWIDITTVSASKNGVHKMIAGKHYYLSGDVIDNNTEKAAFVEGPDNLSTGREACFHLNSKDITCTTKLAFFGSSGTLNIMGSGTVTGGTKGSNQGSAVAVNSYTGGIIKLFSGNYTDRTGTDSTQYTISINDVGGQIEIYEDATIDSVNGRAINVGLSTMRNSVLTIKGATINGNILVKSPAGDEEKKYAGNTNFGTAGQTEVLIDGATINGTVTVNNQITEAQANHSVHPAHQNVTISGATTITELVLQNSAKLILKALTEGATVTFGTVSQNALCEYIVEGSEPVEIGITNLSGETVTYEELMAWLNSAA